MSQSPPPSLEPRAQVVCPFCRSTETEFFSMFGHFLLASQYYCRSCKTVFDVLRWEGSKTDRPTISPQD
jgi:hypothetical protein